MIDCEVIFMPISPVLDRCILFHGLNDHDTASALAFFHAREHSYSRGESLRRPGDPVKSFGLVLEGQVHVLMDDFEGNRMLMASVQPGNTFAESLCYLGLESQIQIDITETAGECPVRFRSGTVQAFYRHACPAYARAE